MIDRSGPATTRRGNPLGDEPFATGGCVGTNGAVNDAVMRWLAILALTAVGCSSSSPSAGPSTGASSTTGQGAVDSTETCHYPANVEAASDAAGAGCLASPPHSICQVSNGATIEADGSVTGGTESCQPICPASNYELTCTGAQILGSIPDPDPSLKCRAIPIPTPPNVLFYCCPCGE
jgi:hypothetical protein